MAHGIPATSLDEALDTAHSTAYKERPWPHPLSFSPSAPCFFLKSRKTSQIVSKMSAEQVPVSLPFVGGKKATSQHPHPLGPLTAAEITESARLIKAFWPSNTNIHFKSITLQEPNKADLLPFLAAEHSGKPTPTVERKSFVLYYIRNTVSRRIIVAQ